MRDRLEELEADPLFRWRGGNVSRIEGLSDGVFALAIALLAFGNVPRDGAGITRFFQEVPAFAACFLFVIWVWWYHYKFFRRYGLQDFVTVILNSVLLFVVLFFINPLGYVANLVITRQMLGVVVPGADPGFGDPRVILWYASGFTLLFVCFLGLNVNAWRHRSVLELDAVERCLAVTAIGEQVLNVSVGVASIVLAVLGQYPYAGWIFVALGPLHGTWGFVRGVRTDRIRDQQPREQIRSS
ncbi:MAG: DUF1211 domain-containing protein [Planctomycetes bacterium]|nr:DUF1211 domain-containing protein [Planctomycetota bacterium]MCB9917178.1 DUF1211 domain-containing protein [Planctomycetota bacterium]